MHGVFLHVLADTLGSITVIVSTVIVWQTDFVYKDYVDPVLSLVIVLLILCSTVPLLQESAMILLQTFPGHINIEELKAKVMEDEPRVNNIHELHIWQLVGERVVASIHVGVEMGHNPMEILNTIKKTFHEVGIHSTTVQIESLDDNDNVVDAGACLVQCGSSGEAQIQSDRCCKEKTCCKGADSFIRWKKNSYTCRELNLARVETTKM